MQSSLGTVTKIYPYPTVLQASHRKPRYGYQDLTKLTEVSGTDTDVLQNSRILWHRRSERTDFPSVYKICCTRTPGVVATGVQNFQEIRVPE